MKPDSILRFIEPTRSEKRTTCEWPLAIGHWIKWCVFSSFVGICSIGRTFDWNIILDKIKIARGSFLIDQAQRSYRTTPSKWIRYIKYQLSSVQTTRKKRTTNQLEFRDRNRNL